LAKSGGKFLSNLAARAYTRWLTPVVILLVIGIFGGAMAQLRWEKARNVAFIGHSDEAAYATMGKSLSEGRGLQVNYITWFFIPYDKNITRREDHWPPFISFCMAPFFKMYGVSAAVAKIPSILIGAIGLPLATALLAWKLSRRGYVGIIAGLIVMGHHLMFTESLKTLSDVPAAMLVTLFCWALLAARTTPWMHLAAGVFAALAYYAKGSELLLLGLYPGLVMLTDGVHWPAKGARIAYGAWLLVLLAALPWVGTGELWMIPMYLALMPGAFLIAGRTRALAHWVPLGMGAGLLLLAPFFYSNYQLFGNPLHSTQNYVSGYMGLDDWDPMSYRVYWGKDLPRTQDRWERYGEPVSYNGQLVFPDRITPERPPTTNPTPPRWPGDVLPREYWSFVADSRAEMMRLILFGVDIERQDPRLVKGAPYNENQWDGLGTWGQKWKAFFQGGAENTKRRLEREGWQIKPPATRPAPFQKPWDTLRRVPQTVAGFVTDEIRHGHVPPNIADTPEWNSADGLDAGVASYANAWAWRAETWTDPLPRFVGLTGSATIIVVLVGGTFWHIGVLMWRRAKKRRKDAADAATPIDPGATAPPSTLYAGVLVIAVLIAIHATMLIFFWDVHFARFAFVIVPLMTVIACTGVSRVLELAILPTVALARRIVIGTWPRRILDHWHVPVTGFVGIALLWGLLPSQESADYRTVRHSGLMEAYAIGHRQWFESTGRPYRDMPEDIRYKHIGELLKSEPRMANAVIMCRNPWELLFYAGENQKGVPIPWGSPAEVFAVARYYGVTHLLWDTSNRPLLQQYLTARENAPAFRRLAKIDNTYLYEIDYTLLPNTTLPGMSAPPEAPPPPPEFEGWGDLDAGR
jgi:hypothetical protein